MTATDRAMAAALAWSSAVEHSKLPANWHGSRCGHNFEIASCPYDGCAARALYEALHKIIEGQITVGATPDAVSAIDDLMELFRDIGLPALRKARGETP